jgi:hypothetical protein
VGQRKRQRPDGEEEGGGGEEGNLALLRRAARAAAAEHVRRAGAGVDAEAVAAAAERLVLQADTFRGVLRAPGPVDTAWLRTQVADAMRALVG